ncbi:MAG: BREX-2 system adenine-specific DNA-methyltransferase PglX [Sandaracinaceae bacterium]
MAKKQKKLKLADLPSEPDPRAPLDGELLVRSLQPVRKELEKDLLARAKASPALTAALKKRHAEEKDAERTADAFAPWQRRFVEQVAAAWILGCVFVRTAEDRDLLEQRRIAGPGAMDAQRTFLQLAPSLSEREYLQTVFKEMTRLPAAAALFDARSPVWMLTPSAEGARQLLQFFRTGGDAAPALRFGQPDTRFLGDLYQDLNENVRKRYALLQTPDFIEAFILDRTLEPAIEKFGLDDADLIDPTCGSGHFLLGAFDRFFDHVQRQKPALGAPQAAAEALSKVYGADINPYAVAIAKFRLTLSYLDKAGFTKLSQAPKLPLHVAVADSLLYNPQHAQKELFHQDGVDAADWERRAFDFEDEREAREVLHREYAAVVGNPPYITVKDKALRDRYRALYPSAHRSYSLAVPFCERFFQLAREGGRTGQITANSFMKREFGSKLIEEFLPTVNLDLIVNTSGAYIPGHGTPTVLLFGSHEAPQSEDVLAVLAKRGEPTTPDEPAEGLVWTSILRHWDDVGHDDDFISTSRVERGALAGHPWSLAGGGAGHLKDLLEKTSKHTLGGLGADIGMGAVTRQDDVYLVGAGVLGRWRVPQQFQREAVVGENTRDWSFSGQDAALWPYDHASLQPVENQTLHRVLWRWRTALKGRVAFGKSQEERGLPWTAYSMFFDERARAEFRIAFAFVATHNHFVLDRGERVFGRTAPIIKLPETATEEDHLALLAYLNSSTACFWMKQVFFDKGNRGGERGTPAEPFEGYFEFDGTKLKALPLPPWNETEKATMVERGRAMDALGNELARLMDGTDVIRRIVADPSAAYATLERWRQEVDDVRARLRAGQEDLDWAVYRLFRLTDFQPPSETARAAGQRASDFLYAQSIAENGGSNRYFRLCHLPTPDAILESATDSVRAEVDAVRRSKELGVIEDPAYKRTYRDSFRELDLEGALEQWILDQAEAKAADTDSCFRLADVLVEVTDEAIKVVADALRIENTNAGAALGDAAVPYVACLRYTDAGLEKRAAWEKTWELQRQEDAGENVGDIPVPPKYAQKDFRSSTYWRLRGKLDVPKERFISYPGCESDEDGEPVYGWAGWDHTQRAQALVALYQDRKTREGWEADRLTPMLAGLLEFLPWLKQWHDEPMPDFDTTFFEAYDAFLENELRELSLTRDDLRAWRPAEKKKGRRRAAARKEKP